VVNTGVQLVTRKRKYDSRPILRHRLFRRIYYYARTNDLYQMETCLSANLVPAVHHCPQALTLSCALTCPLCPVTVSILARTTGQRYLCSAANRLPRNHSFAVSWYPMFGITIRVSPRTLGQFQSRLNGKLFSAMISMSFSFTYIVFFHSLITIRYMHTVVNIFFTILLIFS